MAAPIHGQETRALSISLRRDMGVGLGPRIQGRFSLSVSGPEDLALGVFYLDETEIGREASPPYRLQLDTQAFPPGEHRLHASGSTVDGRQLESDTIVRDVITAGMPFARH